ncbi:lactate dehydrogenase [Gammaproteobacteria bacterium]|nr:lactate dehydrogenase [Gammaproteobacteria bacterium]
MNPVEIEQALSDFIEEPFDPIEFPFRLLACFGRKPNELKSLRSGTTNKSETEHAVLLRNTIHICVCPNGEVSKHLDILREAPETTKWKAKLTLSTDGQSVEAENINTGETFACEYENLADHFGFLLGLAGIATTAEIRNSAIDIKATGRLNRLYIELLKHNEDWGTAERRHDLNQFMTRLIFCFFAEDTGIFPTDDMFTQTVDRMSDSKSENTHSVISTLFQAMDLEREDREKEGLPRWVNDFPYVNGALFAGTRDVPKFSRIARSYLIHAGNLNWKEINPDIFGSMIQAVADDEERGSIGMHYTSVPNILKVLNPLFLDSLREQLDEAEDNSRKLANLRKRISKIRVFDPACGSGNFLVIAYKEMRAVEAEINRRRSETHLKSEIPLSNFRGIEIRDFPTEIARLALIIAEYQCDERYRSQRDALADFLPLDSKNWIVTGNALRLDWLSICPPTGIGIKHQADDLFHTPLDQPEIDFENEGGETFICGNPPYIGTKYQSKEQKAELAAVFGHDDVKYRNADYVGAWFRIASEYLMMSSASTFSFVSTTSLFQGEQAEIIFKVLRKFGLTIVWCHTAFKWSNQAINNAGVSCCIVGVSKVQDAGAKHIYDQKSSRVVSNIGPYLVAMPDTVVTKSSTPISQLTSMSYGSMSNDNNAFTVDITSYRNSIERNPDNKKLFRFSVGGNEFIKGIVRPSLYIEPFSVLTEDQINEFSDLFEKVRKHRSESLRAATKKLSETPMFFAERRQSSGNKVFVPQILSENRPYVTAGFLGEEALVIAPHMQAINGNLIDFAIVSSRIHLVWIATVCGKLKTDYRYSNTLGWNTFPVPTLTQKNKADLNRCAEDILLAREKHFPATIADLYNPDEMPENLRQAHEKNDETLERIYIGRRFKNDTERLEKLFELYTKMTTTEATTAG